MLEGKELEGSLGQYGSYSVDVTDKGVVEAQVIVKVDIIAELEKAAAKTNQTLDDKVVQYLKKFLGRE